MKTQNLNTKLGFNKSSVLELTEAQLLEVDGGTTPGCVYALAAAASSGACAAGAGAVVGAFIAWTIN